MSKLRPLHDRILVEPLEAATVSPGGIIIPDAAKEKPVTGKVLAVGNGRVLENGTVRSLDVKVGDVVLYGKYAGSEVTVDGSKLVLIREEEVLAVQEGEPVRRSREGI